MIHQSVSKLPFGHFNVNAYILCSSRMENSATFKDPSQNPVLPQVTTTLTPVFTISPISFI